MAEAARVIALPYPEVGVVEEPTLEHQNAAVAKALARPALLLGGCCCSHVGAIRGLAERHGRLAVVWIDAHGDLNTPETSPSGNAWGMPLRMAIDEGSVTTKDVALVGAHSLDPPELEYMAAHGINSDVARAAQGADAVYVAFDVDVLSGDELASFMTEPRGMTFADATRVLDDVAATGVPVAGVGFTGTVPATDPVVLLRLASRLGL
jgi:arginase